jgi:hypothetical protein
MIIKPKNKIVFLESLETTQPEFTNNRTGQFSPGKTRQDLIFFVQQNRSEIIHNPNYTDPKSPEYDPKSIERKYIEIADYPGLYAKLHIIRLGLSEPIVLTDINTSQNGWRMCSETLRSLLSPKIYKIEEEIPELVEPAIKQENIINLEKALNILKHWGVQSNFNLLAEFED